MANLSRVRTALTGFPGAPGVATMFFLDAIPPVAAIHDFWDALATQLPGDVVATVENAGDIINDANGELVGTWAAATTAPVGGTAAGPYAAPAGAVVRWNTGTILDGSRLRGRTFIVPLSSAIYDGDGSLGGGVITIMQDAAAAFVTATTPTFVVWHRPLSAAAAGKRVPPGVAHPGGFGIVTGSSIPDRISILRSRRD